MSDSLPSAAVARLEALLGTGTDNALLRFGLGSEYLKAGDAQCAADHLRRALEFDVGYSAAWKLLGKALAAAGRDDEALAVYRQGIAVAEGNGDKQAMKEMRVFAQRLAKQQGRV